MSTHLTTNYSWVIPDNLSENNAWGTELNTAWQAVDTQVFTVSGVASAALPKAGGTMTGVVKTKGSGETVNAKGNISGAVSFDLSLGQYITCTVTGAVTSVAFTNIPTTGFAVPILLQITNGQTAGAWTWGSTFKWPSAVQPVMTASGIDILGLVTTDAGTTYRQVGITKDIR